MTGKDSKNVRLVGQAAHLAGSPDVFLIEGTNQPGEPVRGADSKCPVSKCFTKRSAMRASSFACPV